MLLDLTLVVELCKVQVILAGDGEDLVWSIVFLTFLFTDEVPQCPTIKASRIILFSKLPFSPPQYCLKMILSFYWKEVADLSLEVHFAHIDRNYFSFLDLAKVEKNNPCVMMSYVTSCWPKVPYWSKMQNIEWSSLFWFYFCTSSLEKVDLSSIIYTLPQFWFSVCKYFYVIYDVF